jgi:hypothetical protein
MVASFVQPLEIVARNDPTKEDRLAGLCKILQVVLKCRLYYIKPCYVTYGYLRQRAESRFLNKSDARSGIKSQNKRIGQWIFAIAWYAEDVGWSWYTESDPCMPEKAPNCTASCQSHTTIPYEQPIIKLRAQILRLRSLKPLGNMSMRGTMNQRLCSR